MNRNRAFTLIELLVVIAIIAILAAILFPVFAQAKVAAKRTSELSETKQLGLAALMYCNDSDDVFPTTGVYDFSGNDHFWVPRVAPYIKTVALFRSPFDSESADFDTAGNGSWSGPWISFAANSYMGGPDVNVDNTQVGVFGVENTAWETDPAGWFHAGTISSTSVTKPSETIMLAPKYSIDISKTAFSWLGGNTSWIWPTSTYLWDCRPDVKNCYYADEGSGIPDGARVNDSNNLEQTYPHGKRGGVSPSTGGQANFALVDGHAKSFLPQATNPDAATQPEKNMWNSTRP